MCITTTTTIITTTRESINVSANVEKLRALTDGNTNKQISYNATITYCHGLLTYQSLQTDRPWSVVDRDRCYFDSFF